MVDKPAGWTSFDVVAKVRSILQQAKSPELRVHSKGQKLTAIGSQLSALSPKVKVGHTGTLDPAATGLLILVVGKYTKRAGQFSKLDKTYEAELTMGATSSTGDIEGEITPKSSRKPTKKAVEAVLSTFLGEISQTPPVYSAVKIGGQRAYKLARAGKTVEIEPRKVTIYSISDIRYEYPKLSFTTSVSSGTYIRSLAADIGAKLGTGAYLSSLRRTEVGDFKIDEALASDKVDSNSLKSWLRQ